MDNLFVIASECLYESDLDRKLELSKTSADKVLSNKVLIKPCNTMSMASIPGRPEKPELMSPKKMPRRKLTTTAGRAAMIHSFAHIEFNAINLAWDLICRFQDMPDSFYQDWARVASEETKHFSLLRSRLQDMQYDYGDFPAHNGLWEIAEETKHDVLLRLAVVPRILEARGLDVTPDLIKRFKAINDDETVTILNIILEEEIGHVTIGSKWYRYICKQRAKDPELTFRNIVDEYAPSNKAKTINQRARLMAGFSQTELDYIASH